MLDRVSPAFAFVIRNGSVADEVLFGAHGEEEGGLSTEERAAITAILPHLRESWIGVLTACRTAVWAQARRHRCAKRLKKGVARPDTIYRCRAVHFVFIDEHVHAAIALDAWGEAEFRLFVILRVSAEHLQRAVEVVLAGGPGERRLPDGSFILHLDGPREGETFEDVGRRVAGAFWGLCAPVADAVRQARQSR